MSSYQPAILVEIVENEPAGDEIEGEAVILISRDERGSMEASGTFRSADRRLQDSKRLPRLLLQYEGMAVEGDKCYEIRALMVVRSSLGGLYELEASTEPVVVQRLDKAGKPIIFDDPLVFDPSDELN
ncbi:MAG: hypothetical protein AVDCRST_MAG93-9291 [uncultured Chloroflexia bacterium]|uniref:Uncharacterized protein n=1 Tax=uncultured Chloroflexia bacterium TaxID=1672391 RepID=A0A6J4NAN7_9CHLR|nr:MAG: hypothetical protein AVDCRST_MAG93-9291 [uncultured Chloroflexia bacterium]